MNTKDNVYEYDKAELKPELNVQTENASFLSSFFEKHRTLAVSIISVGSVVALWFLISALHVVPELFLPSPQAVWQKFISVSQEGFMKATLWQHLAASISRVFLALIAAVVIGVPLGLW
ncbi:taurine transporter subunit, partial [Acinetobacter baumannii]